MLPVLDSYQVHKLGGKYKGKMERIKRQVLLICLSMIERFDVDNNEAHLVRRFIYAQKDVGLSHKRGK